MYELRESEIERLKSISKKIKNKQATQLDLDQYDTILKRAGFTEEKIKSIMFENGFSSYEDYLTALQDKGNKMLSMLTGALVGLALVVQIWTIKGLVRTVKG